MGQIKFWHALVLTAFFMQRVSLDAQRFWILSIHLYPAIFNGRSRRLPVINKRIGKLIQDLPSLRIDRTPKIIPTYLLNNTLLVKRGRAICRLVREHVIRHDQGLLFFKGASFGMGSGGANQRTDRQTGGTVHF
jgi:hypothetical protein